MNKRLFFLALLTGLFLVCWTSFTFLLDIPYSSKRLAEGVLLIFGTGFVCSSQLIQEKWLEIITELKNGWIGRGLLVLLVIGIVSSVLANYPNHAFLQIVHYFLLFNFILVNVITYKYKPVFFEYGLLSVIGIMSGLYLANVAVSYLYVFFVPDFPLWPSMDFLRIWFEGIGFRYPEPFLNFVNVRFFNHLQTWSLPLVTLLVLRIPKRYWAFQKIAFIIACGWWMLVFASDARGTMLSSFLAFGFIFYMYRNKAQAWIRTHSLSAAIGLALYFIFFKLVPPTTKGGRTAFSQYSDDGRFELWENAINVILQNPLLGIGPMHFSQMGAAFTKTPHNIYLQFSGEWGLVAGILFLAIIVGSFYCWINNCNKIIDSLTPDAKEASIRVALTASLLAALIHSFFSGIVNTPLSQMMMVLVVGWMAGLSLFGKKEETQLRQNVNRQENPVQPWLRYGLVAVNMLAVGFLIWSYAMQVPNLDENRQRYLEITKENKLSPRYWDQGIIGVSDMKNKTSNGASKL